MIRKGSNIRLDELVYVDGNLGLRIADLSTYDILVGDVISVEFDNMVELNGIYQVIEIDINDSILVTDLTIEEVNIIGLGNVVNVLRPINIFNEEYWSGSGLNGIQYMQAIEMLDDGRLIVGGAFTNYNGVGANRIVGVDINGNIDSGFNYGTGFNGAGLVVVCAIKKWNDKIIVVGGFNDYNGNARNNIIRLNSDGTIDTGLSMGDGLQGGVGQTFGYESEVVS